MATPYKCNFSSSFCLIVACSSRIAAGIHLMMNTIYTPLSRQQHVLPSPASNDVEQIAIAAVISHACIHCIIVLYYV
jgi:hypothetical protein